MIIKFGNFSFLKMKIANYLQETLKTVVECLQINNNQQLTL